MDLPSTSSLFHTCPPSPKSLYQKRKSDIYAPITPRRRSSLTTRYNFAMTNRLLSEACNICLGDYEEGEDICWYENSSFRYNFCGILLFISHITCSSTRFFQGLTTRSVLMLSIKVALLSGLKLMMFAPAAVYPMSSISIKNISSLGLKTFVFIIGGCLLSSDRAFVTPKRLKDFVFVSTSLDGYSIGILI